VFSVRKEGAFLAWIPLAPGEEIGRNRTWRNHDSITAAALTAVASSAPVARARLTLVDRGATAFSEREPALLPTREGVLGGHPAPARKPAPPATAGLAAMEHSFVDQGSALEQSPADRQRQAEEQRRTADELSRGDEIRHAESLRRAEEQRHAEEARRAEEQRRGEEQRKEAESRKK
jgi:hypothetical protein